MKNFFYALLCGVFGLALAGCNTTRGVGQDIQAAGESIEDRDWELGNDPHLSASVFHQRGLSRCDGRCASALLGTDSHA